MLDLDLVCIMSVLMMSLEGDRVKRTGLRARERASGLGRV